MPKRIRRIILFAVNTPHFAIKTKWGFDFILDGASIIAVMSLRSYNTDDDKL